jgi:hypothetical protein
MGNYPIAVGTEATGADATAEQIAVVTPANTEVAGLTARALIDRRLGPDLDWLSVLRWGCVASPVACLAAGVAVEPAASRGGKGGAAPRTEGHSVA